MNSNKPKILAVDDDESILLLFETILPKEGFALVTTSRGGTGLTMAHEEKPDLMLLDLNMPDISGIEVCRLVREDPATRHIPIIMLTAQTDTQNKVRGLDTGADDYLAKPFEPRELTARIRAILRRAHQGAPAGNVIEKSHIRIDVEKIEVTVEGVPTTERLTRKEFDLLYALMRRHPQVMSRAALIEGVWGADYPVTDRTVDATIKRLRQKLGPAGARHIATVEGFGYRFD